MDLSNATHRDFETLVNESFTIDVDPPAELELVSVDPRGTHDPAVRGRQAFALLFRGPKEPLLTQRIYRLRHRTLDSLELFLVPIGPDGDAMLYEAVFT